MSLKRLADRRQRRRQRALFLAILGLLVAYALFVGDYRPHHLAILFLEQRRTNAELADLQAERETLLETRRRLSLDPFALEALAREKGMIHPGDRVYRIVPVPEELRRSKSDSLVTGVAPAPAGAPASATD